MLSVLCLTCCVICMVICIIYMVDYIWNTRVRKHNLRGSENKMNMIVQELMGISVWHYAPLRKKE